MTKKIEMLEPINVYAYDDELATSPISFRDALNVFNGDYDGLTCPVCGRKDCKVFQKEKDKLLKTKNDQDLRKQFMFRAAQGAGNPMLPLWKLVSDFREAEGELKKALEDSGYPYTKAHQREAFANYVLAQKHCRKTEEGGYMDMGTYAKTEFKSYSNKIKASVSSLSPVIGLSQLSQEKALNAVKDKNWNEATTIVMTDGNFNSLHYFVANSFFSEAIKDKDSKNLSDLKDAFDIAVNSSEIFNKKFGIELSSQIDLIREGIKTKNIRSQEEALSMYEKYLKGKYLKPKDIKAIKNALDSLELAEAEKLSKSFGKVLNLAGNIGNVIDIAKATNESINTGSLEPLIYTLASISVQNALAALTLIALSPVSGVLAPVAAAVIMALGTYYLSPENIKRGVKGMNWTINKFEGNANYKPPRERYIIMHSPGVRRRH